MLNAVNNGLLISADDEAICVVYTTATYLEE